MAVVTLTQVQAWLESTKLTLAAFDPELELVARTTAFAKIAGQYDVSGWSTPGTTPALVSEAIAMLIAAWTYQRQYSENSDTENWYATWLEARAHTVLDSIASGTSVLSDSTQISNTSTPTFWPTDAATQLFDDGFTTDAGAAVLLFRTGTRF